MKKLNQIILGAGILLSCLFSVNQSASAVKTFNPDALDSKEFDAIIKLDKLNPENGLPCFYITDCDMLFEFTDKLAISLSTPCYDGHSALCAEFNGELSVSSEKYREALINGIEILQRDYKDRLEGCRWCTCTGKDKSLLQFFDYQTNFDSAVKLNQINRGQKIFDIDGQPCFIFFNCKVYDAEAIEVLKHTWNLTDEDLDINNPNTIDAQEFAEKLYRAIGVMPETHDLYRNKIIGVPAVMYKQALIEGFKILHKDYSDMFSSFRWYDGSNEQRFISELYDYPEITENLNS